MTQKINHKNEDLPKEVSSDSIQQLTIFHHKNGQQNALISKVTVAPSIIYTIIKWAFKYNSIVFTHQIARRLRDLLIVPPLNKIDLHIYKQHPIDIVNTEFGDKRRYYDM